MYVMEKKGGIVLKMKEKSTDREKSYEEECMLSYMYVCMYRCVCLYVYITMSLGCLPCLCLQSTKYKDESSHPRSNFSNFEIYVITSIKISVYI